LLLPESPRSRRSDAPAAAPLLQTAALIAALLLSRSATASPSSAFSDFQAGDFKAAAEEYNRLAADKTNDYRLRYDAGTAAYRAKQLESAQKQLDAALNSPDIISDLQAQEHAYYNLGNTLFRMGEPLPDPQQKEKCWQQSIENFGRALRLNTNDLDAKNNLAYVKQKLEELKKQQQQQQKQNQQDQKDQKNQKDQKDQKQQNQKDQKDQQQQSAKQDQKQDQKSEQQKKDQEKAQQQQAKKDQEKKDQQAQANPSDQRDKGEQKNDNTAMAQVQMSPQEARQLLDAQQDDEKVLIFTPDNQPIKPQPGKFKDW
jgi:Ca-activated chloride channel family protein